jgi:hypothetical protein
MKTLARSVVAVVVGSLAACGGKSAGGPDAASGGDAAHDGAAPGDGGGGCPRTTAAADRVRRVVISHPNDTTGAKANAWEVLELSAAGDLSRPGTTFTAGYANTGTMVFTPDGAVGLAPNDDGTMTVVRLDAAGTPTVVHAAFKGAFYAGPVTMAPGGDHAYVLDGEWRNIGGGIYRVDIACDGTLTDRGLVAAAKLPGAMALVPGTDRAVVAATDIGSSIAGDDTHLLTWGEPPTWLDGVNAFGDGMQIVAGAALTSDGKHFLVGDDSSFGSVPNRVAVVELTTTGLINPHVIPDVNDPVSLVASPFGDVVLAVSGFGNAFYVLADTGAGWTKKGEVTYSGAKPELPGGAARLDVGALRGWVFVAENLGVRRVQLKADGSVVDLGKFSVGTGYTSIVGAIGVTP